MKAAKNDCENNKDDQDSSYLSKDFDRSRFNSSAEALGFSPIKPVGKRDAVSYAQNKAKRMRAGLNEKLANVMEILNKKLNESSLNDCTNCKDLERLIVLIKEKLEISSPRDQIKILTHLRVGGLKKQSKSLMLLNIKLNVPDNKNRREEF